MQGGMAECTRSQVNTMMRKMVEETHRDALAHRREVERKALAHRREVERKAERKAAAKTLFQEAVYSARTDVDPPLWQVGNVLGGFVVAVVPKLGQDPRFLVWGEGRR